MSSGAIEAGIYVHVPFCARVCPYCDFAVLVGDEGRKLRYLEHLIAEIEMHAHRAERFDTIYFGGGTPSALAPEDIGRILEALRLRLNVAEPPSVFLEANPEDVTAERLGAWRRLGIGTLSLGVQSFQGEALAFLGRRHDPGQARRSVELAREAGFSTVSLDLIYALPDQDAAAWRGDLDTAIGLGIPHLSCYQLTVHEGTVFGARRARGLLSEMPDEEQASLFRFTHEYLGDAGLYGYEVSNFAAGEGHQSRHNWKYWRHAPYLGLGPSAHSFLDRRRQWNRRRLRDWERSIDAGELPIEGSEVIGCSAWALEALVLGFRTRAGVDLAAVERACGLDLAATHRSTIEQLAREGWLLVEGDVLRPTLEGLLRADALAGCFELPDAAPDPVHAIS